MKTADQVKRERQAATLARKSIFPKEECHFCACRVPKGALWCSTGCATDHATEKAELLARDGR